MLSAGSGVSIAVLAALYVACGCKGCRLRSGERRDFLSSAQPGPAKQLVRFLTEPNRNQANATNLHRSTRKRKPGRHARPQTHIYTRICTHARTHTYGCTHACTDTRTDARTHAHTYIYTHARTHTHAYTHARTHAHARTHTYTYTRTYTRTHAHTRPTPGLK